MCRNLHRIAVPDVYGAIAAHRPFRPFIRPAKRVRKQKCENTSQQTSVAITVIVMDVPGILSAYSKKDGGCHGEVEQNKAKSRKSTVAQLRD